MKKNVIGIIILILLVATSFSALGSINNNIIDHSEKFKHKLGSSDIFWSEDFDSYILGQCLDGGPDDGGWEVRRDIDGAFVVNNQFHSAPHSVEISNYAEIYRSLSGVYSGNWTFTCWVYVPADFEIISGIFFLSYLKLKPYNCYCQFGIVFSGYDDITSITYYNEPVSQVTLPLITDQWVEVRVEIYFEEDWFECYYNDELLIEREWTKGKSAKLEGPGFLNLANVNLVYSVEPYDDPTYFDDILLIGKPSGLIPDLECNGSIIWTSKIGDIYTGYFTVQNNGMPDSRLEWLIDEYPDWGEWSFQPKHGRLTPEDDPMIVEVTVTAPLRKGEYNGVIRVIAVGDPDDYQEIPVHGTFNKNKQFIMNPFQTFIENYPNLFPLLRQILGL